MGCHPEPALPAGRLVSGSAGSRHFEPACRQTGVKRSETYREPSAVRVQYIERCHFELVEKRAESLHRPDSYRDVLG